MSSEESYSLPLAKSPQLSAKSDMRSRLPSVTVGKDDAFYRVPAELLDLFSTGVLQSGFSWGLVCWKVSIEN
ncbi:hypothetical protein KBY79_06065 [Synechococcus lacustris C3-12m-Tous]|uniref:hypothetical protein n=1 Tax=Synechococcus lacustris TaxID=2116544 RepID=UPI0020CD0D2D|nr:hypothetical protein [Synechococcus lacustris]MCP9924781.1 hypothetical protein [Synechococcus lacustris C3-12m-Tous]